MKCRNCGAELNNGRCEYCDSVFPEYVDKWIIKPPVVDPAIVADAIKRTPIFRTNPYRDDDSVMHKCEIKETLEVTCLGDTERRFIEV